MTQSTSEGECRQLLDVETDEQRAKRIERLLASQANNNNNTKASASRSTRGRTASKLPSFEGRQPQRLEGPSRLLARLEAFLPELKRANEALDPAEASIENQINQDEDSSSEDESAQGHEDRYRGDDLEKRYIEMTLGLGVFKLKGTGSEEEDVSSLSDSSLESSSASSSSEDGESCDE